MEQNNPILKLFSYLSGIFDKPPISQQSDTIKQNKTPFKTNSVSGFLSAHDKLSEKIKKNNE